MGCAQAKPSMESPPRGLAKMKLENGYAKGKYVEARRSTGQRQDSGRTMRPESRNPNGNHLSDERTTFGSKGSREANRAILEVAKKIVNVEGGRKSTSCVGAVNGNVSQRVESMRLIGEDELVDGWPKWLTDNISRQVLRNIVPKSADSFVKIEKVGEGTYSNVYKARDKETGKIVALKKVRFDRSEPESVKFMAREIMILQKLDHPNIVKLDGLATSRMQYSLYLVFEYMQSDLARVLSRPNERLTEPQVKCYMQQLLSGLQHCHERGILHRDIKGSNLLIDKNGMLKIADFGLANIYNPEKRRPLTNRVVTLWYRAPELLLGATQYDIGIDLWSAGCLMAEMLAGRPIMPGRTEVEQLHMTFKLCGTPSDEFYKRMKLTTALKPTQTHKSNLREAFKKFPLPALDLLDILLAPDPSYRGSAASALQHEFFHTSPLPCDLSGLPVVYTKEDEDALVDEKRKHRTKMRRRSQSHRERRKKDAATQSKKGDTDGSKEELKKTADASIFGFAPGSSTSTSSTTMPQGKQETPPHYPSPVLPRSDMSSKTEVHPNALRNVKNRPQIPNGKIHATNYKKNGEMHKLDQVQRSSSTREFRSVEKKTLLELDNTDD